MSTQSRNIKYIWQVSKKEWHLDWKSTIRTDEKREETKGDSKINISFKNTQKYKKDRATQKRLL